MKTLIQPVDVVCMRELRRRIASGYYQVGELLPSENVLAEEFGVGRSMIGRALRMLDKEGFFNTKRGVGRRVCLREYHRKHGQIGLILGNPDYLTKPSGNCLVDSIVKRLRAENLKAKIMSLRDEMGVFHHTMRSESFRNICPDKVDGLILLTQMIEMETTLELSTYCPVVWFHHTSVKPGVAGIRYNWLGGSFTAVKHLLADGRRNIGLVNIDDTFLSGREQLDGIRLALENLPQGKKTEFYFSPVPSFRPEDGFRAARKLLSEHGKTLDAVIVGSDDYLPGVYDAVREQGLLSRIRLLSWNGTFQAADYDCPIDALRFDFEHCGSLAVDRLLQIFRDPREKIPGIVLDPELVTAYEFKRE